MNYSYFSKTIALAVGVLAMAFLISFVVLAWTEPSSSPPTCPAGQPGCDAPLNIGPTAQTKTGDLTVKTTFYGDDLRLGNWSVPGGVTTAGDIDIKNLAGTTVIQLDGDTGNLTVAGTISEGGTLLSNKYLSIPAGSAQGDILIRTAAGWTRLAAGTSGQLLNTQGAGANPVWADALSGAPVGATYITQTLNTTLTAEQALSGLATGILKNTTLTGVLTIAVSGTDYTNIGNTIESAEITDLTIAAADIANLAITNAKISEMDWTKLQTYPASCTCGANQAVQIIGDACTCINVGGGTIGGSGTANYIPKFSASTTLTNSQIYDDGTNLTIGYGLAGGNLYLADGAAEEGDIRRADQIIGQNDLRLCRNATQCSLETSDADLWIDASGNIQLLTGNLYAANGISTYDTTVVDNTIEAGQFCMGNGVNCITSWPSGGGGAPIDATYITQTSNATLTAEQALSGLATGILKNTTLTGVLTIAVSGTDYTNIGNTIESSEITDLTIAAADIANSAITNAKISEMDWIKLQTYPASCTCGANQAVQIIGDACTCINVGGGTIGGSGTANYIPLWTGATTQGTSTIYQSGSNVGIGTTAPGAKLTVNNPTTAGKTGASGDAIYAYANSANAAISAEQGGTGYAGYFSGNVSVSGNLTVVGTISEEGILLSNKYLPIPASSAQGDILIRATTSWTRLAAGTSGQLLKTMGAGANPVWADPSSLTWPLYAPNGSLLAPSYSFSSQNMSGMWWESSSSEIVFSNGASRVMTMSGMYGGNVAVGNWSIGPVTPTTPGLDLSGALTVRGWSGTVPGVSPSSYGRIYFDTLSNRFMVSENGGSYGYLVSGGGLSGGQTNYIPLWTGATTQGTSTIYQSGGNVGIGTTTPSEKLTVQSASGGRGVININQVGTDNLTGLKLDRDGSEKWFIGMDTGSSLIFRTNSSSTPLFIDNLSGDIYLDADMYTDSIWMTNPSELLYVAGVFQMGGGAAPGVSSAGQGRIYFDSTTKRFMVSENGGTYGYLAGGGGLSGGQTNYIPLWTGATTQGTSTIYQSGGIVGIGTTAPGAKLTVNNPTAAGKTGASGDAIYAYANSVNSAISAEQANAAGYAGYFSGNVSVTGNLTVAGIISKDGTESDPSYAFSSNHNTGMWYESSTQQLVFSAGTYRVMAIRSNSYGQVAIGPAASVPTSALDLNGALTVRGMATAPGVSPTDQGRIYYNPTTDKFMVSENGGAYANLAGGGGLSGGQTNYIPLWTGATTQGTSTIYQSGGIVGIGTTAPGAKLTVNNPTAAGKTGASGDAIYAYANSVNSAISAEQANAAGYAGYFSGNVSVTGNLTVAGIISKDGTESDPSYAFSSNHNTGMWYESSTQQLVFSAGTYRVMAIRSNSYGQVAIGPAASVPTSALDLNGALTVRGMATAPGVSPTDQGRIYYNPTTDKFMVSENGGAYANLAGGGGLSGGQTNYIPLWTGATTQGTSTIYQSGSNVGIGTASPSVPLHVKSPFQAQVIIESGANSYAEIALKPNGTGDSYLTYSNTLKFYSSPSGYTTCINSSGDIAIGMCTATPGAKVLVTQQGTDASFRVDDQLTDTTPFIIDASGNVGIGTTGPLAKLAVGDTGSAGDAIAAYANSASSALYAQQAGTGYAGYFSGKVYVSGNLTVVGTTSVGSLVVGGGTGKITAGTVDPIFDINGKKYATYMADYVGGTRVETSGNLQLTTNNLQHKTVIDLEKLEKESDLWLFWQASNKNLADVTVLLTPGFDGKVWYEKNGTKITIYGDKSGEVSYRLSAPRIDYQKWGNVAEDQGLSGIKVIDYEK